MNQFGEIKVGDTFEVVEVLDGTCYTHKHFKKGWTIGKGTSLGADCLANDKPYFKLLVLGSYSKQIRKVGRLTITKLK